MKQKLVAYIKHYARLYGLLFVMIFLTIIVSLSLQSFRPDDVSFFYHATNGTCHNILGYFGATLAAFFVYLLGTPAYFLPFLMMYSLVFMSGFKTVSAELDRIIGLAFFIVLSSGLCQLYEIGYFEFSGAGGVVGSVVMSFLSSFDTTLKAIILCTLLFASTVLIMRFAHLIVARWILQGLQSFFSYVLKVDNLPARLVRAIATSISMVCFGIVRAGRWAYELLQGESVVRLDQSIMEFEQNSYSVDKDVDLLLQDLFGKEVKLESIEEETEQLAAQNEQFEHAASDHVFASTTKMQTEQPEVVKPKMYALPDIEKMLVQGTTTVHHEIDRNALAEHSAILEEKLALFGVRGKVMRIHPGPVITLFEYKPESHIKLSKILGLEDDLAMALQALNIRILAPIPGKDVVGFEVANKVRNSVLLSNIFHGTAWTKFKGHLPLILGEDTYGNHMVVDLASMPHLLIAGSTGSGKSVALNCMLVSMLCAKKPDELKLIIIDPKQIEFTAYERVAHLLFPIITDSKKAVPVLKWVVMTMEERYQRMAELGAKNIFDYQRLMTENSDLEKMPFIVVIIDELADLMMTTGKDAEDLIARIAQMSRAAGIHMIVATQRPSVDVITGLIKVNFPNRISFKVTSKVDSRTILDEMGAERLLGKGDMLFIDAKDPQIRRVHGAYVSDKEVHYLVKHIEAQQPPEFLDVADMFVTEGESALFETDQDLFQQVADMLKDCDEISISMIQRRFRIGYNRSARIVETLEARGLIMPSDGGKMRRVVKD